MADQAILPAIIGKASAISALASMRQGEGWVTVLVQTDKSHVIASGAKQSMLVRVDCFASLAMTNIGAP
jgi:NAD(P)H-hydrate repair Nnr-like enzyme with NAD(P)H-hydrate dehydratase domain